MEILRSISGVIGSPGRLVSSRNLVIFTGGLMVVGMAVGTYRSLLEGSINPALNPNEPRAPLQGGSDIDFSGNLVKSEQEGSDLDDFPPGCWTSGKAAYYQKGDFAPYSKSLCLGGSRWLVPDDINEDGKVDGADVYQGPIAPPPPGR